MSDELALDCSANSDAVIELGIQWTKQLGAKLVGIAIVDQPMMLDTAPALETDVDSPELQGHWKQDEERVARGDPPYDAEPEDEQGYTVEF